MRLTSSSLPSSSRATRKPTACGCTIRIGNSIPRSIRVIRTTTSSRIGGRVANGASSKAITLRAQRCRRATVARRLLMPAALSSWLPSTTGSATKPTSGCRTTIRRWGSRRIRSRFSLFIANGTGFQQRRANGEQRLMRFRWRRAEVGYRLLQRGFVFHVHAGARAINLTQESAEHPARAILGKVLHGERRQSAHGLVPLHCPRYLAYERIARLLGGCD